MHERYFSETVSQDLLKLFSQMLFNPCASLPLETLDPRLQYTGYQIILY